MVRHTLELAQIIEDKRDDELVEVPVALLRDLIIRGDNSAPEATLTTQQVADALGVSRPWVVKLIDAGELPSHRVGTHRRVRERDLIQWKDENRRRRLQTLSELAALDRELRL